MVEPVKIERIGVQPPGAGVVWAARYAYDGPCEGGRYLITTPTFYNESIGIIVTEDGTIPCETSVLQVKGAKSGRRWSTPQAVGSRAFTPHPFLADLTQTALKWELIYSGRSGNEVVLDYREYSSGPDGTFARPAFYQQLKYDLSQSDRVVFRAVELQIIEASNSGVEFRVLRDAERDVAQPSTGLAPRGATHEAPTP